MASDVDMIDLTEDSKDESTEVKMIYKKTKITSFFSSKCF